MIRKVLQPFYTAFVLLSFLTSLLVSFPFMFVIGLWDKPGARKAIWNIIHYWAIGWLAFIGMPLRRIGKKPDKERYVYVANHISYMDTVVIYAGIPHYFRTLAKKEMANIPIFGYIYKQMTILVDRSSEQSRARSMRLMWRVLRKECNIAIFPEGTFNETDQPLKDFYSGAFRLAINTQKDIVPVLFPDTVSRWHYSAWWKLSPGRNRVVYLPPISVQGLTMDDLEMLKKKVYKVMEKELSALNYPAKTV